MTSVLVPSVTRRTIDARGPVASDLPIEEKATQILVPVKRAFPPLGFQGPPVSMTTWKVQVKKSSVEWDVYSRLLISLR